MMRRVLKVLAALLIPVLAAYCGAAFIAWEVNPGAWSMFARVMALTTGVAFSWAAVGYVMIFGDE